MKPGQEDHLRLTERAAQWFGALKETNAERTAFFDWLAESPRQVDAFLSVLVTAQEIAELTPGQQARIEELAGEAREIPRPMGAANIVPLTSRTGERIVAADTTATRRPLRWKWGVGVVAGLAVLAAAAWLTNVAGRETYSTAVGEQRKLELTDGSIVYLNTRSQLEVRFTDDARAVRLLEGQALFKVRHDAVRPFIVESGKTAIQAVGTQFDVYRRPAETRVAVIEGLVRISPPRKEGSKAQLLAAGENADIATDGKIMKRARLKPEEAAAWRQRRLVFREDTLGNIAAEFNRYNVSLQIRVVGEAASNQHFSGTFDADAPETLAQALAGDNTLKVERGGAREIVIRAHDSR